MYFGKVSRPTRYISPGKLSSGDHVTSLSPFPFVETWQKSSHFGLTLIEFPPSDSSRNSGCIWKCTGLLMASTMRFPEFAICTLDFRLRWLGEGNLDSVVSIHRVYRDYKERSELKEFICSILARCMPFRMESISRDFNPCDDYLHFICKSF